MPGFDGLHTLPADQLPVGIDDLAWAALRLELACRNFAWWLRSEEQRERVQQVSVESQAVPSCTSETAGARDEGHT
jgi:hypothetical protein